MKFKTLDDLMPQNKRVLIRVDLNLPLSPQGVPTDTTRLERVVPTLQELLQKGAKLVILSHLGRPDGKVVPRYSLEGLRPLLENLLQVPVGFLPDLQGQEALAMVEKMEPGQGILAENVRFYPGEETNDPEFVQCLARLGDVYVNDAFSASHRAHASLAGIAQRLPSFAGRLLEEELKALEAGLTQPERPLMAIVGGAKVSTKLTLLSNLLSKVDRLMVGGGMANTFLLAKGFSVGKSLCEPDMVSAAQGILQKAQELGVLFLLPSDVVVKSSTTEEIRSCDLSQVGPEESIMDIGPRSQRELDLALEGCQTVTWNGPLGLFEVPPFQEGTLALARALARRTQAGSLKSIAGGGDTVAALHQAGCGEDFTYVSTAGGAFLEWMEGRELPGVVSLYSTAA